MQFVYPAHFSLAAPDEVVVSFRDLPECLTSGADTREALSEAVRRMLDPRHATSLRSMANALRQLGCSVAVEVTQGRGAAGERLPDARGSHT
ncbi:MAG: hypothetical protein F4X36_03870 [Gammaproteobacteria bacterium]|nr:hypothetical protein [Gammaproteobacteria bacterium]